MTNDDELRKRVGALHRKYSYEGCEDGQTRDDVVAADLAVALGLPQAVGVGEPEVGSVTEDD